MICYTYQHIETLVEVWKDILDGTCLRKYLHGINLLESFPNIDLHTQIFNIMRLSTSMLGKNGLLFYILLCLHLPTFPEKASIMTNFYSCIIESLFHKLYHNLVTLSKQTHMMKRRTQLTQILEERSSDPEKVFKPL